MTILRHDLLDTITPGIEVPTSFGACLNARGLYNSLQFVLRLSPVVHRLVDDVVSGSNRSWEGFQAYSTYVHETVHWWQHVGSTLGLVVSMSFPAQSHSNIDHLRFLGASGKLHKSIKAWADAELRNGRDHSDGDINNANVAVNNALDIEFFKALILRPDLIHEFADSPYFLSVGHSFHVAYGAVLGLLSTTCDTEVAHLPDPRVWSEEFAALGANQVEGYYPGSPIGRPPVGLLAILEGQARFIQLQFLSFANEEHLAISDLRTDGYLSGVYTDAFDWFLRLTKSEPPETVHDPLVGLFLLICDLSINPMRGFPLQIEKYDRFITDVDPGIRFYSLCMAVQGMPTLKNAIREYSRSEYEEAAGLLAAACGFDHPFRGLEEVSAWALDAPGIAEILAEKESFRFEIGNLPIRVIFSHFVSFSIDKLARPEFFCWAGAHMVGERATDEILALWLQNLSLFSDKEDDDGVFPRDFPNRDREAVDATFNGFYANNVMYDLTRQWILQDGPFQYDFGWLSRRHASDEMAGWAKELFSKLYGISPDAIQTGSTP